MNVSRAWALPVPKERLRGKSEVATVPSAISIVLSLGVYLAINKAFNHATDPALSLAVTILAGAVSLTPMAIVRFGGVSTRLIVGAALLVFIAKICLSITHFLYFVQPNYFTGDTSFRYVSDYEWLYDNMCLISEHWRVYGLFTPLPSDFWISNKNGVLLQFMAMNSYVAADFPLNIIAWNALFSIYTALMLLEIAVIRGARSGSATLVYFVGLLLPVNAIASILWRDTTGIFLVVLAVNILVLLERRRILWLVAFPFCAYLTFLHREPYLLCMVAGGTYHVIWIYFRRRDILSQLAIWCALVAFTAPALSRVADIGLGRAVEGGFFDASLSSRLLGFPFRLVRGIVGPFPWTAYFQKVSSYDLLPAMYAQHVLMAAVLWCATPIVYRTWRVQGVVDYVPLLGYLFFLSGVIASGEHTTYIAVGVVFLIPAAAQVGLRKFRDALAWSAVAFVGLNIIYVGLGLSGLNFWADLSGGY